MNKIRGLILCVAVLMISTSGLQADNPPPPTNCVLRVCLGDFNGDGVGNFDDLLDFLEAWLNADPCADLDGMNGVDTMDIWIMLDVWFHGCR